MPAVKTILVPTDFSETAEAAAVAAFELAARRGAKVFLLHAYGVPALPDAMVVGVDLLGPIEEAVLRALEGQADKYQNRAEFGGVLKEMGDPRNVVVQQARALPADMIVMGTHGRSGLQHLLLGSVAERVVRTAPCPVLVIPPRRKGT